MDKPTIYIYPSVWDKILTYSRLTYEKYKTEVGGMSPVIRHGNKWIVTDAHILKQETTGTETQLDKQELANYMARISHENIKMVEENRLIYLWWHTHPNFGATMSGTDWSTISDYAKNGSGLALVVNNDGEYELILSVNNPVEVHINCDLKKFYETETFDGIDKEIEELVTKKFAPVYKNHYQTNFFPEPKKEKEDVTEEDIFNDNTREAMIDISTFQIDNMLDEYANGKVEEKDVVAFIITMNDKCLPYDLQFTVPEDEDVKNIVNAHDLLQEVQYA